MKELENEKDEIIKNEINKKQTYTCILLGIVTKTTINISNNKNIHIVKKKI